MSNVTCEVCGNINGSTDNFCSRCGNSLISEKEITLAIQLNPDPPDQNIVDDPELYSEKPALKIKRGEHAGELFYLPNKEITLGRDPSSDVFLDDITVSRAYAKIFPSGSGFQVQDIDSTNGTYLNNSLVEDQLLQKGDKLQIGKYILILVGP